MLLMAYGLALALSAPLPQTLPASRACTTVETAEAMRPVVGDTEPWRLTCRLSLNGNNATRRILIEGREASGAVIDCGGGALGRQGIETSPGQPTVAIWSRRLDTETDRRPLFSRPTDVTVRNCTVHGAIRIWGMGTNGRIDDLRQSSRRADHSDYLRRVAPSHITLERLTFEATGSIPLYIGPGVTEVSLSDSRFVGRSVSTAIYLDAESRRTRITHTVFDIETDREQIAVDGSADNIIADNRFDLNGRGGIFLYRNCGEDGVIRHQTPSDNRIAGNVFSGARWVLPRTVVVGSREGRRRYCNDDRGWPFGSSVDDGDQASGNIVTGNRTVR